MSFLFYGDPERPRRRSTYQFHSIEKSSQFKQLKELPALPKSAVLRQDRIFTLVADELKQISTDVSVIYSKLRDEMETERQQTEEVDVKINNSLKRLESSYSKLCKLRSKHAKSSKKQRIKFDNKSSQLNKKIRAIRDANDELLDYIIKNQLTADLDEKKFRMINRLLKNKFPDMKPSSPISSNTTESKAKSSAPTPLTMSSILGASAPSLVTTFEHVCLSLIHI